MPEMPDYRNWWTVIEAEQLTGIDVTTFWSWIQKGWWTKDCEYVVIPGQGRGGKLYFVDPSLFSHFTPGEKYLNLNLNSEFTDRLSGQDNFLDVVPTGQ